MYPKTAKLVTFGEGGDTVYYGRGCTGTGYGNPENPHAARPSADCIIPDGTPAIDKRPAIATDDGYRWVFRGPMVNVDLDDGGYDPCPQPSALFAGAMAEGGGSYGTMLALQACSRANSEPRGPLDSVSIREYVDGWRDHGARIGHYENGQIVCDS